MKRGDEDALHLVDRKVNVSHGEHLVINSSLKLANGLANLCQVVELILTQIDGDILVLEKK